MEDLKLSCEETSSLCWQSHRSWTKADRLRIIAERKTVCEACPHNPAKQTSSSNDSKFSNSSPIEPMQNVQQLPTPPKPELLDAETVKLIETRVGICATCEQATKIDVPKQPQPEATAMHLKYAITRAEFIHGIAMLTCKKCGCGLAVVIQKGECEKWKEINNGNK